MSYPPFNNESWEGADSQPLVWTGSGWYYDGVPNGCDVCVRSIKPKTGATWHIGYVPTHVTVSVTIEHDADLAEEYVVTLPSYEWLPWGSSYHLAYYFAGSYDIEIDLTGMVGDISTVGFLFGSTTVGYIDRPFTITNIQFFPDLSSVSCSNWTSHIGTRELTV